MKYRIVPKSGRYSIQKKGFLGRWQFISEHVGITSLGHTYEDIMFDTKEAAEEWIKKNTLPRRERE